MHTNVISSQPTFTQGNTRSAFFGCCGADDDYDEPVLSNGTFNHAYNDDDTTRLIRPTRNDNESTRWVKPNQARFPLQFYCEDGKEFVDMLHNNESDPICQGNACLGSLMRPVTRKNTKQFRDKAVVTTEMIKFLDLYYKQMNKLGSKEHKATAFAFTKSIQNTGLYDITTEMLLFGAKTAWRNAARCVGRIQWSNLKLFDRRDVTTGRQMFEAICNHINYANNGGNLRSAITIFPVRSDGVDEFRVWSTQLIAYAGYQQSDGSIIGDPVNAEFTLVCERLGWRGKGGRFDILPIVVQADGKRPEVFELPKEIILEVQMTHPRYPWFKDLGLKWFALPAVSHMCFEVGGLEYPAAPFNGWYMSTEIASRDLCDKQRYNVIPAVAEYMDLDTTSKTSLWKDITMVEVNVAVLYSFQIAGVTIMDHHTATETFVTHMQQEQISRGGCPADWVWIVPPISGSLTPVFHMEMLNYRLKPSYEYQQVAWVGYKWDEFKTKTLRQIAIVVLFSVSLMSRTAQKRVPCKILYATETGKSFHFAQSLATICKNAFTTEIVCTGDYDISKLPKEKLVFFVTSTFGEGDAPDNGKGLKKAIWDLSKKGKPKGKQEYSLKDVRFSIFALGSRAYPKFCQFGEDLDYHLQNLAANKIYEVGKGDELCGQETSFREWAFSAFKVACDTFSIQVADDIQATFAALNIKWQPSIYRIRPMAYMSINIVQALSDTHNQKVARCRLVNRENLQAKGSDRETLLLKLEILPHQDMEYSPGDHLGIFASNSAEDVDIVMNRVIDQPQDFIDLKVQKKHTRFWKDLKRTPFCNLRTSLTHFLDIHSTVSQSLMEALATIATDEGERKILNELATDVNAYQKWKLCCGLSFVEMLEKFTSLEITATFLLTQLPVLLHRFYSISSSQLHVPNHVHLTVSVLEYNTLSPKNPRNKVGFCSYWLKELPIGSEINCFTRKADAFHLPENDKLPVIMVGPGTGIAPFRSFWQQRKREKYSGSVNVGPMILYFGCRRRDQDHIYEQELKHLQSDGILNTVYVAVSRQPGEQKRYVQNMMADNSSEIFLHLVVDKGHLYICGDAGMAADVTKTLLEIFKKEEKKKDPEKTMEIITNEGRIHRDIFGASAVPKLSPEELETIICAKCLQIGA